MGNLYEYKRRNGFTLSRKRNKSRHKEIYRKENFNA